MKLCVERSRAAFSQLELSQLAPSNESVQECANPDSPVLSLTRIAQRESGSLQDLFPSTPRRPATGSASCRKRAGLALMALLSGGSLGVGVKMLALARESSAESQRVLNREPKPFTLAEPEPATGFHATVMRVPLTPPLTDFEPAMFVADELGEHDYGIFVRELPQSAEELLGNLVSHSDPGRLPCRNTFVLQNREAYSDYLRQLFAYSHDTIEPLPLPFPQLRLAADYVWRDGNWTHDPQLDRVLNPDGSAEATCRSQVQLKNEQLFRNASAGGKHPHAFAPRWETGFRSIPANLAPPRSVLGVEFELPDELGQQAYGIDFTKTPTAPSLAKQRLHVLAEQDIECVNEFARQNREVYIRYVDDMAECERLAAYCYPNVPALNRLASPLDARLDRVIRADGSQGQPCQTVVQIYSRQAIANFTKAVADHEQGVARFKADQSRLSREYEQAAGAANAGGFTALALGVVGLLGTVAAVRRSACTQRVSAQPEAEGGAINEAGEPEQREGAATMHV